MTALYRQLGLAVLVATVAGAACSDAGSPPAAPDQGADLVPALDSRVPDAELDAEVPDAAAVDVTLADAGAGNLPSNCSGPCADQTLSATFGSVTEPLERAVYGIDRDAQGNPGVYMEALHGGFSGCPEQRSPTPERTLIISGLPLPVDTTPVTKADGLVVSLLDFTGTLTASPVAKATSATVVFTAASVCAACVGQPAPSDPDGFVALDLTATFANGAASGHVHAVHCDSLDL